MDHRHLHWTPYISGNDRRDQSNNHMQEYYTTPQNTPVVYSMENSPSTGILRPLPPWNPMRHLNVQMYTPNNNMGTPLFRHDSAAGPSHDPFRHPSTAASFNPVTPLCYPGQTSSSSAYGRRIENDPTMNDRRGSYKRKTRGFSGVVFERGSSSSHFERGGSSRQVNSFQQDAPPPINRPFWGSPHVFPNPTAHQENTPLPTPHDQASFRNVRSRVFYEPESNLTRTPFNIPPLHHHHPGFSNPTPSGRSVFHISDGNNGAGGAGSVYSHGGCTPRIRTSSSSSSPWGSSFPDQRMSGENNPYRNPRSNLGSRNNNRSNGRWYRSQSGSDLPVLHHYPSQAVLFFEYHRSRDSLDRHRDMRLDVDHMSYEELLALGERIGNVSTGLTEEMVSDCISDICYVSSSGSDEGGGVCAVCLEEYEEGEMVGRVKKCGHEYHRGCINKWLGLKNSCPICKATAC